MKPHALLLGSAMFAASHLPAPAAPLTATLTTPPPASAEGFVLGSHTRPDGATLTLDSRSLRLNGEPWVPVMGEFHFTRYPAGEWERELRKMKAGGIDIVATYVFWIHHEETEGEWNWSGRHDLRRRLPQADVHPF